MTTNSSIPNSSKTWFITGASSGIGLALTTAALNRGDNVAAIARNVEALDRLAVEYDDKILTSTTDVRDEAAVRRSVDEAVTTFGTVDVVVNSAAFGIFAGIEEVSADQWRDIFDTNFFGTLNVLRATLPVLRRQHSGHVLLGSAHYGQSGHSGVGAVAATKHAVEGITDSLREEVAPLGIHVTTFEPGFTATAFLKRLMLGDNTIPDYDATVRATFSAVGQMPPEAFNSAEAVSAALLSAVDAKEPPLRLAVGSSSYDMIKASLESRLKDLEDWTDVSRAADSFSG